MADSRYDGVLIDLSGVLYEGDRAIDGAAEALQRLRGLGLSLRFVTNTTRRTSAAILDRLGRLGFDVEPDQLFSAPLAVKKVLEDRNLRPMLLIHPDLQPEFDDLPGGEPDAVVVGDAGEAFTYGALNRAFRLLLDGATLLAMGDNRYFKDESGMCLDQGPFVRLLEYAADVEAAVLGKPSADFFRAVLDDMGVAAERAVMIGDDLRGDVGGAQAAGLDGVLVRTGKFRPADETDDAVTPTRIVDDFAEAVAWIHRNRDAAGDDGG